MKKETRLIGVGVIDGIEARDLKVGDTMIWNYGSEEKVVSIEMSKSGKTMKCQIEYVSSFTNELVVSERKMNCSRIVVIK